jgi:DNA-binding IclR family transcriptional regulator
MRVFPGRSVRTDRHLISKGLVVRYFSMRNPSAPGAHKPSAKRYAAPALDKGLDILELFANESDGFTASEVARRLGRTVGEIFRMLVRLEQRGYVCQIPPDDRYFLTLKLFEVAQRHSPLQRLVSEARPLLQRVAHKIGQSCHLAMPSNGEVVVVAQVDAPGNMGFSVRLGARIDLLNTASGHTILAFQRDEVRSRSLATWQRQSGKKIPHDLPEHLARIRRRGNEEMDSHQVPGITDIGFPVLDQHGEAIAAMMVPFLPQIGNRAGIAQAKDALRLASSELSAAIGGKVSLPDEEE